MASGNNSWPMAAQQPAHPAEGEEFGLQARPMGLKVHYTFDRDGQVQCLARWPHILQIQTIPLDDTSSIGVVDLRTCLQAIANCSPEIVNQAANDYTVYAHDYSEPNVPLVGQGMLSWGLDPNSDPQSQQLLTGRVTRNMLAIFGNGIRETLEVKLKLTAVARMNRTESSSSMDQGMARSAATPTDSTASEWNSFIQSNPTLGHSGNVAPMPSPSLRPSHLGNPAAENRFSEPPPQHATRPSSIPPLSTTMRSHADAAPSPVPASEPGAEKPGRASRPASRARNRTRPPTGRPRGRPRKKPLDTGSTSAAEEATDGDDGPQRKRAKVTKAEHTNMAPFGSAPDSLRVAASTSGSLRNMRPVGSGGEMPIGSHLQDIPRAPTPVPELPLMQKQQQRRIPPNQTRRGSMPDFESQPYQSRSSQLNMQMGMSQDARSPTESIGQSPDQGYSPGDSVCDLGSSPPAPRTGAYVHSSPVPSSPILPPMPAAIPQVDSGFMSGGMDDFFDDEELQQDLAKHFQQPPVDVVRLPPLPPAASSRRGSRSQPQQHHQTQQSQPQQPSGFSFQPVNPGPPELLPTTSIFNPAGKLKSLNRAMSAAAVATVPPTAPPTKEPNRRLKRSNTAPIAVTSEADYMPQEQTGYQPPPTMEMSQGSTHPQFSQQADQDSQGQTPLDIDMETPFPGSMTQPEEILLQDFASEDRTRSTIEEGQAVAEHPTPTLEHLANPVADTASVRPATASAAVARPPTPTSRLASRSPLPSYVAASDPAPMSMLSIPDMPAPPSEALCPPSDALEPPRYNKNAVKKQSIKERLEIAIEKGEMPPFCNNCGAIETPTWRKIWTQDHDGVPGFHEFSDKPGQVTTIDVLERDSEGKPAKHRLVKKNLGPTDEKKNWTESLLCNPCGIWLAKFKGHRPPDRWEKDAARLNQPRRKRDNKGSNSRSKKAKTKNDGPANPTSEAYFTTDPLGPMDQDFPEDQETDSGNQSRHQSLAAEELSRQSQPPANGATSMSGSPKQMGPGSTHSRGSGTMDSPIAVDDDLGATRRLLFPSPRKDGVPKVLGELAVNMVQTTPTFHGLKSVVEGKDKENALPGRSTTPAPLNNDDLEQELFGTPPARPCTPPPKNQPGPFKTPTRPTPSHRPITRSISRSIRTVTSIPKSPSHALFQVEQTPTKTPSSGALFSGSKRRTPHRNAHFALDILDDDHLHHHNHHHHLAAAAHGHYESPFTASLNQLLSEANEFTAGSPSHGLVDLDLSSLPNLDSDGVQHHLASTGALDFGSFLSTDIIMPSSPPMLKNSGMSGANANSSVGGFSGSFTSVDILAQFTNGSDGGDGDR